MKRLAGWVLSIVLLGGCGIKEMADETKREVQHSNELQSEILVHIKKTSDAVHLQVLTVAMQQMLAPENTANLDPPIRMMPYAETFVREATSDELIKVCYVLLTDAQSGGGTRSGRLVSLMGMSALASMASAEKTAAILRDEVEAGGRYRDAAYVYSLARYVFTRDFLLAPILEKTKYLGPGALRDATAHFTTLRDIRALPYQDRLVLEIQSLGVTESIPTDELKAIGQKARRRFQEGLEPGVLGTLDVQGMLKKFDL